jgi:hypothetical protein
MEIYGRKILSYLEALSYIFLNSQNYLENWKFLEYFFLHFLTIFKIIFRYLENFGKGFKIS